uniref:Uncharacterized protein n=2 Tax=Anguilla anguilla TaxID=7936 RepID=A0A0E9PIJ1_ANGAN
MLGSVLMAALHYCTSLAQFTRDLMRKRNGDSKT